MKNLKKNNENILTNEQINHTNQQHLSYNCPHCQQQIITFENEIAENILFNCPGCGKKAIIRPFQKEQHMTNSPVSYYIRENAHVIDERKNINFPAIEAKIVGLLLIILGISLQFVFNLFAIKITFAIFIIGVIIFAFIPDNRMLCIKFHRTKNKEKQKKEINTQNNSSISYVYNYLRQFDISEKIAIVLILWIIFIYLLTGVNDIDLFVIFVYLGILIVKVFSSELISFQLKQRMNVFTIAFLFIFILVIIRRILTVVHI